MSTDKILTSSGFYVSQEAPIHTDNPIATPSSPRPTSCAARTWRSS